MWQTKKRQRTNKRRVKETHQRREGAMSDTENVTSQGVSRDCYITLLHMIHMCHSRPQNMTLLLNDFFTHTTDVQQVHNGLRKCWKRRMLHTNCSVLTQPLLQECVSSTAENELLLVRKLMQMCTLCDDVCDNKSLHVQTVKAWYMNVHVLSMAYLGLLQMLSQLTEGYVKRIENYLLNAIIPCVCLCRERRT